MPQHIALTESTFYVLMALYEKDTFGTAIVDYIKRVTNDRVPMGPGTLYTILAKFEKDKFIKEVAIEGRKRTYSITPLGRKVYEQEIDRLQKLIIDARKAKENYKSHKGDQL